MATAPTLNAEGSDFQEINPRFIQEFKENREEAEGCIQEIKNATAHIESQKQELLTAVDPEVMERCSQNVQQQVHIAQDAASRGKDLIERMREKGHQLKNASPNGESSEWKLQRSQYMHVYQAYMGAISQHQIAKTNFKEISADRLVQRARVVFPDKSEDELRRQIEEDPQAAQRQLEEPEMVANYKVQAVYDEVMSRSKDVGALVQSLKEVKEMMNDLALMVQQQHEVLGRIDANVEVAKTHVKKGNEQVEKAINYQRKARKRMCCMAITVVIIILLVIVIGIPVLT
eukprot:gb/GECG01010043.1/.p1 GENE.gb/GECG01010043.1/~~gb/GECG01010043.1/.p1  ORF type:complete len:288 (+),score=42.80 gb/GECG01010043.1/:1-864(+)